MRNGIRHLLILVLLAFTFTASPSEAKLKGKEQSSDTQIAKALDGVAVALQEANKPKEETKPCAPGEDNRQSDLCAQWKAADAAVESANWTRRGFFLAVAAAAIGLLTLAAAGAAAWFARDAALEARRGANAAEDALTHAKDVADMQIRPYIVARFPRVKREENIWTFVVKVINAGNLVAKNVTADLQVRIVDFPVPENPFAEWGELMQFHVVMPGLDGPSKIFTGVNVAGLEEDIAQLRKVVICKTIVSYTPLPHLPPEISEVETFFLPEDIVGGKARAWPKWADTGFANAEDQGELPV